MRAALLLALVAAAATAQSYNPNLAMSALYFCKAAYCDASAISSWSCGACSYHPGMQSVSVFTNSSIESQGFTGYDSNMNAVIVAFRGSSNIPNWISDLNFFKTSYPYCSGCEVHRGFFHEWQSLMGPMMPTIRGLVSQYNAPVLVTGHSLGAAVTILAAMDIIRSITSSVTVYNFGEPRVGTPVFTQWATSQLAGGRQFRVTHERDPVPHVPPMDFGFLHAPHELWYDNDGSTTWKDCQDSASAEDPSCSDSIIPYGIDNHLLYLGVCTECPYTCSSRDKPAVMKGAPGNFTATLSSLVNAKPKKP